MRDLLDTGLKEVTEFSSQPSAHTGLHEITHAWHPIHSLY
jgi:hypothetical protein